MTQSLTNLRHRMAVLALLSLLPLGQPALADGPAKPTEATQAEPAKTEPPKAEQSVTQGRVPTLAGGYVDYTATAGTLLVCDNDDKPIASVGYVAYTKNFTIRRALPAT